MMFGALGMEGSNRWALKAGSSGTVKLFILGNQTKLSCAMHKFSMFTVGGGPTEKEKSSCRKCVSVGQKASLICKVKMFAGITKEI